ncbi:MAG: hypothetical protein U5N86_08710 [Planctomycetota bacterium]|nr:hypothetical protein [Planctomycetota bacterium]
MKLIQLSATDSSAESPPEMRHTLTSEELFEKFYAHRKGGSSPSKALIDQFVQIMDGTEE